MYSKYLIRMCAILSICVFQHKMWSLRIFIIFILMETFSIIYELLIILKNNNVSLGTF